jgi:hypothetical protein
MRTIIMSLVAALALAVPSIARADAPGASEGYFAISDTLSTCLFRAQAAETAAGLSNVTVVGGTTVYGDDGTYEVGLRCAPELGVAFIFVAGPDSDQAADIQDTVQDGY